jgi:aldehyde dehydrogenase (NAD+)
MTTVYAPTAPSLSLSQQEIDDLYAAQRHFFNTGVTRSYAFRKGQLATLKAAIQRNEKAIIRALHDDLHKNEFEAYGTEIGFVYNEISHTIKHLRQWMENKRIATPLMFAPASSKIINDPLGTVLIISPWNYPFNLMMAPLVAAIAGGNTVILKPSELAPATEAVIAKIINETFEPDFIAVLTGAGQLLGPQLIERHHLDHIFYTGSTQVGRIIMQHAATQLTPVTLELGGKSPCIVDETANITWAAKKIAWGKFINAGQTCVAPDYVLVHESVKDKLVAALKEQLQKMYGENPAASADYPRIINQRRFRTLAAFLDDLYVLHGGQHNESELFFAPTLVTVDAEDHPLWHEEIFGPILPIRTFSTRDEVLQIIDQNPYPLALYLFSSDKNAERFFTERIRFGGGCINNTIIHLGNNDLPFGGVGYSGMGQYHGHEGFSTFSRAKSIMKSGTWFDTPVWYPPVKDWYVTALRKLLR